MTDDPPTGHRRYYRIWCLEDSRIFFHGIHQHAKGQTPVSAISPATGTRMRSDAGRSNVTSRLHSCFRRDTLFRQLHTPPLPAAHVPIGYC
jgi:hypothetical protein